MESVRNRFLFTVGTNIIRASISFSTGMLLARLFGPDIYGRMVFILGTFVSLRQLLDLGTSSAFFTFLSQKTRSKKFVYAFFGWLGIQFSVSLGVIGLIFPSEWIFSLWQGEQRELVMLAFTAVFMQTSVWPVIAQAGESQRRTRWIQGIGTIVVGVHFIAVVTLWWFEQLGLYAIFIAIMIEYILAAIIAHRKFEYENIKISETESCSIRQIFKKYFNYCIPLLPYSIVGFIYTFLDRWLLQRFAGGVEQAYYDVGARFASVALIATTSILKIFWKEIAEAMQKKDIVRMRDLYRRLNRCLFFVSSVFAGFLIPWSYDLLQFVLGERYVMGAGTFAIMLLYPVHQSMGQIAGTMLYATEKLVCYVVIGIGFMLISIGVTYFVLAPKDSWIAGLDMAGEGLAFKMVGMQLIQANVTSFVLSRIWGWRFDWIFQPIGLGICMLLGWVIYSVTLILPLQSWPLPIVMGVSGVIYLISTIVIVFSIPSLVCLTRNQILSYIKEAFMKFGWNIG